MKIWRKALWLAAITGVSTSLLLVLSTSTGETYDEKVATIMVTTSLRGEVSPCG